MSSLHSPYSAAVPQMPIKCLLPLECTIMLTLSKKKKKIMTQYSILCTWNLNDSSSWIHDALFSVVTVKDHEDGTCKLPLRPVKQHRPANSSHIRVAPALCFLPPPAEKVPHPFSPSTLEVFTHTCLPFAPSFVISSKLKKNKTKKICSS